MPRVILSLEEIIATLKRSAAPTLIVEGKDDYVAFSEFEIENIFWGFTVFPVYGKGNVEKIFSRVDEIAHPALAFLMDRDCTIFTEGTEDNRKSNEFYTDGYAIENDLLRDGKVERLLTPTERPIFHQELALVARFFACAAACHVRGQPRYALSTHPQQFIGRDRSFIPEYETWIDEQETHLDAPFRKVHDDPMKYVKGKVLTSLFTRHLSGGRKSSYSTANLLEIGSSARGPHISKIERDVLNFFVGLGCVPPVTGQS